MRSVSSGKWLVGASLLMGGSAALADEAEVGAAVSATHRDEQGIVHYAFDPERLPGARRVIQQGELAESGGCDFADEGEGTADGAGPKVVVMSELTFDAARCVRELAVAEYPLDAVPEAIAAALAKPAGEEESATEGPTEAESSLVRRYIGSLRVNVEDPVQKDVTSTTAYVAWSGTRTCVTSSSRRAYWNWFSPSGWRRTNATWNHAQTCAKAHANVYGKFKNPVFCATIDTWTEHQRTLFEGRPNGGWAWSYRVRKWGGCNGLLHFEYILTRP